MLPIFAANDVILDALGFQQDGTTTSPEETVYPPVTPLTTAGLDINDSGLSVFDDLLYTASELMPPQAINIGPDIGNLDIPGFFPGTYPSKFSNANLTAAIGTLANPGYLPSFNGGMPYLQGFPTTAPGFHGGENPHFDSNTGTEQQTGDVDINGPAPFSPDAESIYTPPPPTSGFFDEVQNEPPAGLPPAGQPNNHIPVASVPEPGIGLLFVLALVGLAMSRKKLVAEV